MTPDTQIICCGIVHEIHPKVSKAVCIECGKLIYTKESAQLAREILENAKKSPA